VVLLMALAVHSIFETVALGLANTPVQALLLATSIALHQPAESIALLVAFIKSKLSDPEIIKYLSVFSAVGPAGLLMGENGWTCVVD
jgi:solute carrier family 39 (zinc transporter), member 1/2/3